MATSYIDQLPDIVIKDGMAKISYPGDTDGRVMPLRIYRLILAHAQRVLAEHDAAGKVIMVPKMRLGKQK